MAKGADVKVRVHNSAGELIRLFVLGPVPAFTKTSVQWDATNDQGRDCAAGVYVFCLQYGRSQALAKAALLR